MNKDQQNEVFTDADGVKYDIGSTVVVHKIDENDSKQKRLVSFSPDYDLGLGSGPQSTPSPSGKLAGDDDADDEGCQDDLNLLENGGEIAGHGSSLPSFGGKMHTLHGGHISPIGGDGFLGPELDNRDGRDIQFVNEESKRSPHNRNQPMSNNFTMKYLNDAGIEGRLQKGSTEDLSLSYQDGGIDGDSRDMSHDQTLIWALRKELAGKTKLISELKNQVSQQSERNLDRDETPN